MLVQKQLQRRAFCSWTSSCCCAFLVIVYVRVPGFVLAILIVFVFVLDVVRVLVLRERIFMGRILRPCLFGVAWCSDTQASHPARLFPLA